LANILTIPPLIYPFQYNPTQVTDSKQVTWSKKDVITPAAGGNSLLGGLTALASLDFESAAAQLGRTFSKADFRKFEAEGERTLSFQLTIDGREQRPGEPARRRNKEGDILGDLAILRSFVYPQLGELMDILGAAFSGEPECISWFNEPPTALLIMGDLSVEGFVSNLRINETLFNSNLDPVRAEVDITLIEKIDSFSFVLDSVKRLGRTFYQTAYEDIGNVLAGGL
jgi:hypothetical protein